jgi:hypothetical protein
MVQKKTFHLKFQTMTLFLLLSLLFSSCDFIDPTKVDNPEINEESLEESSAGGASSVIAGLRRDFSKAVGELGIGLIGVTEIVSDNYVNRGNRISTYLDNPRLLTPDNISLSSTDGLYYRLQNLRAIADLGFNLILPNDFMATDDQRSEIYFYKGFALLLLSENFSAFPIQEQGSPITSSQAVQIAIENFKTSFNLATSTNTRLKNMSKLALARAYRLAGDKVNAEIEAKAALALSTNYVFYARYNITQPNNVPNGIADYVYSGSTYDMQPNPRLDYLDPKYSTVSTSIPMLKSEEMHLILAEVALANNDLAAAKTSMNNAITLTKTRATITINDLDPRIDRPNDASYKVKAGTDTLVGVILKRSGGSVKFSAISNVSLTSTYINSLSDKAKLVRALYILRQEIFFLEGRRMSDLGIRLPVMRRQIETNPNMPAGSLGTLVVVPDFIPIGDGMDKFSINTASKLVILGNDMNQIISDNYDKIKPFK